jgi:hypothetical protein
MQIGGDEERESTKGHKGHEGREVEGDRPGAFFRLSRGKRNVGVEQGVKEEGKAGVRTPDRFTLHDPFTLYHPD